MSQAASQYRLIPTTKGVPFVAVNADFHLEENRKSHKTVDYNLYELIVRRGQTFDITVKFNRDYNELKDNMILLFDTGNKPTENKGSRRRIASNEKGKLTADRWGMQIKEVNGAAVRLSVMPSAASQVGKYSVTVATQDKKTFKIPHPVYILFNAWCPDDTVFMDPTDPELMPDEYVLEDVGCVWRGSYKSFGPTAWAFGQFEEVSLECALYLLDKPIKLNKSSPTQVVRALSGLVNSKDNRGVLVGNWDPHPNGYPVGTFSPSSWTGSVPILTKYMKEKESVKYGQCWVFSALCTTLCRALGIPTRSVTNFASGRDTDKSLAIDYYFRKFNGRWIPLDDMNDDFVWNFHVWNESWFKRPDLPNGYDGWQAFDATPQETSSDGDYRCGPASVKAIKEGDVYLPYDAAFMFAEVNGDCVYWEVLNPLDKDDVPELDYYGTINHRVGKFISTLNPHEKALIGETGELDDKEELRMDITTHYKHAEGSDEERKTVQKAHEFMPSVKDNKANANESYELHQFGKTGANVKFDVKIPGGVTIGDTVHITVSATNEGTEKRTVLVSGNAVPVMYTGRAAKKELQSMEDIFTLDPGSEQTTIFDIGALEYAGKMAAEESIKIFLVSKVEQTGQRDFHIEEVEFKKPSLRVSASPSQVKPGDTYKVTVSFTNPLPIELTNGKIRIEAPRSSPGDKVIELEKPVGKKGNASSVVTITETFTAMGKKQKDRKVVATFDSVQLGDVRGVTSVSAAKET